MARSSICGAIEGRPMPEYSAASRFQPRARDCEPSASDPPPGGKLLEVHDEDHRHPDRCSLRGGSTP